ncbi:MAG: hypothetical protein FJ297_12030 [Planctomycetes bacterium]|nr:hypothetical protein [Planctomycetota bacterium]
MAPIEEVGVWYTRSARALGIAAILAVVCGCGALPGNSPAEKIVGRWTVDPSSITGALMQKIQMQLEITREGRIVVQSTLPVVGAVTKGGTWRFLSAEGNKTRIEVHMEGVERAAVVDIQIVDPDTIELVPPNTPVTAKVRFRREKATVARSHRRQAVAEVASSLPRSGERGYERNPIQHGGFLTCEPIDVRPRFE